MRIDHRLNLVVPVLGDDNQPRCYVHHTPIAREVFERYFLTIRKAFGLLFTNGLPIKFAIASAPLMLRKVAEDDGEWEDSPGPPPKIGVRTGLVEEIRRMTMVVAPTAGGWQTTPWHVALNTGLISQDDADEVEMAVVFFTLGSHNLLRAERKDMLEVAAGLWGGSTSSLNSTAYADSLMRSTPGENTGAMAGAAPVQQQNIPTPLGMVNIDHPVYVDPRIDPRTDTRVHRQIHGSHHGTVVTDAVVDGRRVSLPS